MSNAGNMPAPYTNTYGHFISDEEKYAYEIVTGGITLKIEKKSGNIVYVSPSAGHTLGLPFNKTGRHRKCNTKLKYYDGLIYCGECDIIVDI
jgi:hypothetical protein